MNECTRSALEVMRDYWRSIDANPIRDLALAECERAVRLTQWPLTDEQLAEYLQRLEGPDGCDFREKVHGDPETSTWRCRGGHDKRNSTYILRAMGLGDADIAAVHLVVDVLGGHCDCEILFNAAPQMLPALAA